MDLLTFPLVILAIFVLSTVFGSFFTVATAQVAVVTRFGAFKRVAQPGLNWKVPFIDRVAGRVSLRVNQVFNALTTRGRWDDGSQLPASLGNCNAVLRGATIPDNVTDRRGVVTMGNHHLKHVGIYRGGTVWNFSNNHAHPQVISETAATFRQRLTRVYGAGTRFFYGYQADI